MLMEVKRTSRKRHRFEELLLPVFYNIEYKGTINIARIAMAVQVIEVAPVINLSEASGQVAAGLFMTEG